MKKETKEAIKKVLLNMPVVQATGPLSAWHDKEVGGIDEALTSIISAVDRERVGEVVLHLKHGNTFSSLAIDFAKKIANRSGRLVFIPDEEAV